MKALRIKAYQQTACYKKPHAVKVSETYPLPPYSTVNGFIMGLLAKRGDISYQMEIEQLPQIMYSIQGKFDNLMTDYRRMYFLKDSTTESFPLTFSGLDTEYNRLTEREGNWTTMPIYQHQLNDVYLVIHISADEEWLEKIKLAIAQSDEHFSLGRREDLLVLLDEPSIVELTTDFSGKVPFSIYLPKWRYPDLRQDEREQILEVAPDLKVRGIPYTLHRVYEVVNGVRKWKKIHAINVSLGEILTSEQHFFDEKALFSDTMIDFASNEKITIPVVFA